LQGLNFFHCHPNPLARQTWYLYLGATESNGIRIGRDESFIFPATAAG